MLPAAVALPKTHDDIRQLVKFAIEHDIPLTPRAAGTSLSGQPIGKGIIVDVGRYMNQVIEVNKEESWARIHPGVIRNELNEHLESYG
jgi:FAD/FMN-containing dehydrogenase